MSAYEVQKTLEMLTGSMGGLIGPVIAAVLSGVVLTYCIRWFIFVKAGQRGWKALIPFYSDYITYKIAWDGRIYLATLTASIASFLLGGAFGMIHPALGTVLSVILSTIAASARAIAGLILKFKLARAFGKNDYFFIGLYFLNNVFTAILAFGDSEYQGPPQDRIGVPKFMEGFGRRNNPDDYRPMPPVMNQPVMPPQPPVQMPVQPGYPRQYPQQYPPYQQPGNTNVYTPVQQYPRQNMNHQDYYRP